MSVRWTQVKKLDTTDAFRDHCASLGVEIPIDDTVDPAGALAAPVAIRDGSARHDHRAEPVRRAADGGVGRDHRRPTHRPRAPTLAALRDQRVRARVG